MVDGAAAASEATLEVRQVVSRLQWPDEGVIDYTFHGFTDAADEGYRTQVVGFTVVCIRFGNRNYCGLPPRVWDETRLPDVIKQMKQQSEC